MKNTIKELVDEEVKEKGLEEVWLKLFNGYEKSIQIKEKLIKDNRPLLNLESNLQALLEVIIYLEEKMKKSLAE